MTNGFKEKPLTGGSELLLALSLSGQPKLNDSNFGVADLMDDFERETEGFTFKIIP